MTSYLRLIIAATILFVAVAHAQKNETYSGCKKKSPEAGILRVVGEALERMNVKKVLPPTSDLQPSMRGDVQLLILVDHEGSVACAAGLRGEAALIELSTKAVKQWKLKPFVDAGKPWVYDGIVYFYYGDGKVVAGFLPHNALSGH